MLVGPTNSRITWKIPTAPQRHLEKTFSDNQDSVRLDIENFRLLTLGEFCWRFQQNRRYSDMKLHTRKEKSGKLERVEKFPKLVKLDSIWNSNFHTTTLVLYILRYLKLYITSCRAWIQFPLKFSSNSSKRAEMFRRYGLVVNHPSFRIPSISWTLGFTYKIPPYVFQLNLSKSPRQLLNGYPYCSEQSEARAVSRGNQSPQLTRS